MQSSALFLCILQLDPTDNNCTRSMYLYCIYNLQLWSELMNVLQGVITFYRRIAVLQSYVWTPATNTTFHLQFRLFLPKVLSTSISIYKGLCLFEQFEVYFTLHLFVLYTFQLEVKQPFVCISLLRDEIMPTCYV